ncbi:hypothetical protein M407DRAFT_165575 [Tulasnella calospora MUT 4182]|uniref:Transcription initiation factor TFIID subunit 8 n=1 Tax=Tulasnella calospora MUT 4182 TaxID=1051891 RepID=A0A0C3QW12_9AGAM|nr:hypothetical protein M407DRAFT_165575 [Tulasnella calospora MUT 4182]
MSFVTHFAATGPPPSSSQPVPAAEPAQSAAPAQPGPPITYASSSQSSGKNNKLQVTYDGAARAIRHLIAAECQELGFSSAEPDAMENFEEMVALLITQIANIARGYADASCRSIPNARDVVTACEETGFRFDDLRGSLKSSKKRMKKRRKLEAHGLAPPLQAPIIVAPPALPKPDDLLPSDSEPEDQEEPGNGEGKSESKSETLKRDMAKYPKSLQSLPLHFPRLPPKHTYLRTEPPPPKTTSLSSLQAKIDEAAVIQDSLRNLIQATEAPARSKKPEADEDTVQPTNQPIPPGLAGGFVNWEGASGLRKPVPTRWKV